MRVLMASSEAHPYAKTGGLADVLGALPQALVRLGHAVDVMVPRYRGITQSEVIADGVRFLFVDHPGYFDRDYLYGTGGHDYADNAERFAYFARAAVNQARLGGYDVVHAHDWQAGLVPLLLGGGESAVPKAPVPGTVLTIHNLAYQGIFDASWLPRLALPWTLFHLNALEFWGRISYLKAGLLFSRILTTVSPRYAREIQTPEYGCGFDGILRYRAADLVGILNGIDYNRWNPRHDPHLPAPYDASKLEGKALAKRALLAEFGFGDDPALLKRPIVGMISRLVDQKGFDLVADLADELPRLDATFVMLGSGDRRYEDLFLGLASRYPGKFAARIGFDEALAHRIEGGSDLFLMPSRFEPCGLNQMYSLRYGTLPLVRATGGLYDTVRNYDAATGAGTGFTFDEYSAQALLGTLRWALSIYEDRGAWRAMQVAGMRQDLSWDASAKEYEQVYKRAIGSEVAG